jgi:hypothetical protein
MTGAALSMILDVFVLGFLGVTIYYAIRLTNSLNAFRQTRQEFATIMRELSRNIDDAQHGVESLKKASHDSGQSLQKIINESRKIAVELEIINQDANTLRRGNGSSASRPAIAPSDEEIAAFRELEREMLDEAEDEDKKAFSIFDRDYDEVPEQQAGDKSAPAFSSQAERDLYEALQKNKSSGRRL